MKSNGHPGNKGQAKNQNGYILPLVSIITATFNAEKDLDQCIHSVLGQKYDNIEFIIIDGASTDTTLDIIKKYDDQIDYWISEKDRGVYDALNKGINVAKGEWLYFLGADDRLADDKVLQNIFSKPRESKLLYGNVRWGDTGRIYDGEFSRLKLFRLNICQQAIFYHRDLFTSLGRFNLRYNVKADWVFNMKAFAAKDVKPCFIDIIVADYNNKGMSSDAEDENLNREREDIFRECFGKVNLFRAKLSHFLETRILSAGTSK